MGEKILGLQCISHLLVGAENNVCCHNQRGMTMIKKTVTMGAKSFSMPHFSFYLTIIEIKLIF